MHERVDPLVAPQAGVERDVAMARRTGRVVVALLAVAARTAVRLQQQHDVASAQAWEAKLAVDAGRVRGRVAPSGVE